MSGDRKRSGAALILFLLCITYIFSQFFRNSTGVIGPELMQEFNATPAQLGLLSSLFFFGVAIIQIPIGVMLDRIGPRHTIYPLMGLTVAGALLFAFSDSYLLLSVSRFTMGIGCAAAYIGATIVCARWFSGDRFAAASGFILSTGNLGAILATTPLGWSASEFGWRETFIVTAIVTLLGCLWGWAVVRDAPPDAAPVADRPESQSELWRGFWEVAKHGPFLRVLTVGFTNYPLVVAILGLWGAPYLFERHGLNPVDRGNILLVMAISTVSGFMIYGQLDRLLNTRKWLILPGLGVSVLALIVLALFPGLGPIETAALFAVLGLFGSFNNVSLAHGRALFPPARVGRMAALFNLSVQAGVGVFQLLTGLLLAAFPLTAAGVLPGQAWTALFLALAAAGVLAMVIYAPLPDAKPSEDRARIR